MDASRRVGKAKQFIQVTLCKRLLRSLLAFGWLILPLCSSSKLFSAENSYEFKGVHFLASYCECDQGALSDIKELEKVLLEAVEISGATILNHVSHLFPPNGLTMVILLSESHASIHTYPEHRSCFVDLFTCGNRCCAEAFDAVLKAYLKPNSVNKRVLMR